MEKNSLLLFCIFLWLSSSLVCCSNSESPETSSPVIDETAEILEDSTSQVPADSITEATDSLQTTDTIPEVRDIEGMILLPGGR